MPAPPAGFDLVAQIPPLRRYARALTGDPWAADDLVQDTLERACSRRELWRAGSDLRAWLFTLMHNLFVDGTRRAARQAGPHVDAGDAEDELATPDAAPDRRLDLQRCLLRLPEEQREVLLLVTLQDLAYEAVQGYELVGGRLLPGDAGARAQFMFQDARGERLTLYVGALATTADGAETAFRFATSETGVASFYWVDQGFGYALAARLPRQGLHELAEAVYRQL